MRSCKICDKKIQLKRLRTYCSIWCRIEGEYRLARERRLRRGPEIKIREYKIKRCVICKERIPRVPGKVTPYKYCSNICRKEGERRLNRIKCEKKKIKPFVVKCVICESPFMGNNWTILCSDPCRKKRSIQHREFYKQSQILKHMGARK
jgi:hypothetical protein